MLWDLKIQMLDFREKEDDEEVEFFGFLGLFYFWLDDCLFSWKERNSRKLVPFYVHATWMDASAFNIACQCVQHMNTTK